MRKSMWLLSAGAFALSAPAYAQEPPPEEVPAAETAPSPTEAASTEDEGDVIVVTAQGRQQILQDVPIAVTAITNTINNVPSSGPVGSGERSRIGASYRPNGVRGQYIVRDRRQVDLVGVLTIARRRWPAARALSRRLWRGARPLTGHADGHVAQCRSPPRGVS